LYPNSVQERSLQKDKNFSLYPIPASKSLWFSARIPGEGRVAYTAYDLRGAALLHGEGELSAPVMIDVGQLQCGFYLLLMEFKGEREIHKFVISR